MAAESAGTIVYDVEVDLSGLLNGQRQINSALEDMTNDMRNLQGSLARTERSVESIEGAFSDLSSVAKGVFAALSVQQVGAYAQAWQDLSNKLSNAVRDSVPPFETLADVTERVFNIAQRTRSGLESTAELYARLERSTRSYGVSVDQLAKLTTIINQGFIVSGASAEEASNAITQLAQGLASGALRGDEFNSVNEQGNRLMIALADSMGVGIGQLRNMAAEGKLTTDVIVNGLLSQGSEIGAEFAKTTATIGQSMEIAGNNVTKFFGENSTVKTGVKIFSDGIITMSENVKELGSVLTIAAAIMGGRYAGAIAMATAAKVKDIAASRARLISENQTAQATLVAANNTVRRSLADKEAAISAMNLAQAEYNVARGSAAEALALDNLIATKTASRNASLSLTQAEMAQAAAQTQAAAAARAASVGIGTARGAFALIGGPAGAAVIAAAGVFYFYQKMQQARQESIGFADKLDGVIAKMKDMSQVQLAAEIDNASRSIKAQADALKDTQSKIEDNELQQQRLKRTLSFLSEGSLLYKVTLSELTDAQSEHTQLLAENERAQNKLSQTVSKTGILRAQMNGSFAQGIDLLKRDGHEAGVAAGLMNQLGDAINFASRAKQKFNSSSLQIPRSAKADDFIKQLEDENTLLAITDNRLRAVTKARMEAAEKGGNQNQINAAGQLAGAQYDLQQAEAARNKETKAGVAEGKRAATQTESIAQKLANLKQQSELAGDSTRELSREQSILTAQQSLGKGATQEQIALAGQYAAKAYDNAAAIKAQAQAEKERQDAQKNFTSLQGQASPVAAADNTYQQQMAQLDQYVQLYPQKIAEAEAVRNAIEQQYRQQRLDAMWQEWAQQSEINQLAANAFDALGNNASSTLSGILTGTESAGDAMRGLANSVVNQLLNSFVQMGIEWAKSAILGATTQQTAIAATTAAQTAAVATQTAVSTTAAATTAAAWTPAAILSSIASMGTAAAIGLGAVAGVIGMNLLGKRKNGGPVSAGGLYQVGESGLPEIYQASNGRQYMIPGDNGSVISNKDMQSGGGINVQLNVQNYSGATVDAQASSDGNGGVTIDMIVADLNNGGPVSQGIVSNFNVKRKARGQG
ncbi:tape measure protein [Mixta calida]|uniref:tape measure protein n=1 Tax=Mixta calida TaxID=665913 RepID=UPI002FDD8753